MSQNGVPLIIKNNVTLSFVIFRVFLTVFLSFTLNRLSRCVAEQNVFRFVAGSRLSFKVMEIKLFSFLSINIV
jgi:hypothetical protein